MTTEHSKPVESGDRAELAKGLRTIASAIRDGNIELLAADVRLLMQAAALLAEDDRTPGAMTPQQINEVNESLWAEIDEIKEKTGYNAYREENRGVGHWTLLGYLLNLKHRAADDKAGGEVVALTSEQIDGALEAADELFQAGTYNDIRRHVRAVSSLRAYLQSLAGTRPQPQAEYDRGWKDGYKHGAWASKTQADQPEKRVALTDERIAEIIGSPWIAPFVYERYVGFARAIEAEVLRINGLTEAETNVTASVIGLTRKAAKPEDIPAIFKEQAS